MNRATLSRALLGLVLFAQTLACNDVTLPNQYRIDSLRVLGVTAQPATLTPGESAPLTLICADGIRGGTEDPNCNVEVAWFAGCNNPEKNDPKKCLGQYGTWFETVSQPIAEMPPEAYPAGFMTGTKVSFSAPNDILAQSLTVEGNRIGYGTSYVYFAVCAGQLVTTYGSDENLPVECHDRATGKRLGPTRSVFGVTTIYSYDLVKSRNPGLLATRFDGALVPTTCTSTAACPNGFECTSDAVCVPVVKPCDSSSCWAHCLDFDLGPESFSLFNMGGAMLPAPQKSLWIDYYTNAGSISDEARFGLRAPEAGAARQRTGCTPWWAPPTPTEHAHLWAVVRDNRGGLTVHDQRIIVR